MKNSIKHTNKILSVLFAFLFISLNIQADDISSKEIKVSGIVQDQTGVELPGVSISVKGIDKGTITNASGEFSIMVSPDATLIVSFVGMETKEIAVKGRRNIVIVLKESSVLLDEVVAIGYGKQSRALITNSISKINKEEFQKAPGQNPLLQLQGKVPGLSLQISSGQPGADPQLFIRGGSSTSPESDTPLIIIDGIISQGFRNISDMNPADIESIEVLKDAASTAIYGSRAANGIILVKTKSGQKGKPVVSLRYTYGVEQQPQRIPLLNARDYITLSRSNIAKFNQADLTYNGKEDQAKFLSGSFGMSTGNPRNSKNTLEFLDVYLQKYGQGYVSNLLENEGWQTMADPVTGKQLIFQDNDFQKATFTTGQKHEIYLSISGGTEAINYYVGLRYLNQDGILRGTNYKNYSVLFNGNYKLSEAWSLSTKASLQVRDAVGGGNTVNTISRSILTPPTYRLYYEDGTPAPGEGISSFRSRLHEIYYKTNYDDTNVYRTTFQLGAIWNILPGLILKPTAYYFGTEGIENYFQADNETTGNTIRPASAKHNFDRHLQGDLVLSYDKKVKDHNIGVVAGASYTHDYSYRLSASGSGSSIDLIPTLNATADSTQRASSTKTMEATLSYFGRVNYDYNGKYLFSISMRADGSSRFAEDNKWGFFPAFSAAWRISEEKFMKQNLPFVSNMKLRLGWGIVGNDRIANFLSLDLYTQSKYGIGNTTSTVLTQSHLKNKNLKWEGSSTTNLGVDLGFFDNRLNVTADFFIKNTKDLLLAQNLAYVTGFSSQMQNIGKIQNRGIELAINSTNIQNRNFTWSTDFNISFIRNELKALSSGANYAEAYSNFDRTNYTQSDYRAIVGESLGLIYGYEFDGIYQVDDFYTSAATGKLILKPGITNNTRYDGGAAPGVVKYKDQNGDGKITTADRTVIGNAMPKWFGGITNSFSFKGIDFSFMLQYSYGNDVFNATRQFATGSQDQRYNMLAEVADRWSPTNASNKVPSTKGYVKGDVYSRFVEDGSFLRLKNMTLGYSLPKKWINKIHISKLRIYGTAQNLFCISGYSGYDPEVSTAASNPMTPGLDWGAYPKSRVFTFGLDVQF